MPTFPLITHPRPDSIFAWREGHAITAARFLSDVAQLSARLPAGAHMLNACNDRYRFAVGLAAAMVANKASLLPATQTPEMIRQLLQFAPDAFCLTDSKDCAIALPQFFYPEPDAVPEEAAAAQAQPFTVPQIDVSQLVAYVFTSGSTGAPVPHRKTWGALVRNVRAEAQLCKLLDGRSHALIGTVQQQHMYGFEYTVLIVMQSGNAMATGRTFYPADICKAIRSAPQPRVLISTPVHLRSVITAGLEIPPVDLLMSATAPLSVPLAQENDVTWASGGHGERPVPMHDVIESVSADRFLLHGRTADLVNIAGKRSSLAYLNLQLNAISGALDGAFYMPDEAANGGVTRLTAFVVAPELNASSLMAALRERIDPVFLPRPLIFVDALPRSATGKLPRDALTSLALASASQSIESQA